jgi:hypothetical protein
MVMQKKFLNVFAVAMLMSLAAYGQSLGDIARMNREKQDAQEASGVRPRVITNKDLPEDPEGYRKPPETQPVAGPAAIGTGVEHRSAEQRPAGPFEARAGEARAGEARAGKLRPGDERSEQWKRQIMMQENRVANLQARIEQLSASRRSMGGSDQSEGPYNGYQARREQRVAQMRQHLDEQKRRLDEMQEAARHAGMRTGVYEP